MVKVALCDPFFWEQPSVLVGGAWWRRWSRTRSASCASEMVNEIAAVYLFTAFVGLVLSVSIGYVYAIPVAMGIATLYLIPAFLTLFEIQSLKDCSDTREAFENVQPNPDDGLARTAARPLVTSPTAANPFMNVLIDEIKYNPTRPEAADVGSPAVADSLDAFFRVQWSSDPTDVFGRTQSQRMFVTQPATSIPNDQESYQNWLYRIPGKTCKEGGREACLAGTDGGPIPWLNQNR
jgi:hypothetical protein